MREEHTSEALSHAGGEAGREPERYVPRPKWQIVMAWVLFGIVVLGIVNLCWLQITGA